MNNANEVLDSDLQNICDGLATELPSLYGRKVLITGGAGFLGYYLVQAPLYANRSLSENERIEVLVYDNFSRGIPDWLEALRDDPALTIVKHDVRDPLPDSVAECQYIIHAATIASPTYYRLNPIETMDANIDGLRYLLDHCVARKKAGDPVEGMLFYSTSEIYGDPIPEFIPTPETYRGNVSCTGPRACYDESKRYGETLCVNFAQQYGVPVRIARPFNNYGPGLKITDRRALPDFARDILAGRDIVLYSDGSPTRTFCYITDAITGYYKVLLRGRDGESYNIGKDQPEISIRQLAESVVERARGLFDYTGDLKFAVSSDADYLTDNPNRRCPVIDKARAELGYEPRIELDEGLTRSLLWYADNQEAEDS